MVISGLWFIRVGLLVIDLFGACNANGKKFIEDGNAGPRSYMVPVRPCLLSLDRHPNGRFPNLIRTTKVTDFWVSQMCVAADCEFIGAVMLYLNFSLFSFGYQSQCLQTTTKKKQRNRTEKNDKEWKYKQKKKQSTHQTTRNSSNNKKKPIKVSTITHASCPNT